MRSIRYQVIADALRERIATVAAGQVLSSEAELCAEFGASRVTVRKALESLRDEGVVESRQGFGWVVTGPPVRQHLGALRTIEHEIEVGGKVSERRVLEFAFVAAPADVAATLGVDQVLRVKRLTLASGEPFAVVTVWCPAGLAESLSRRDVERSPFYELLGVRLRGATQTIGADTVSDPDATLLQVPAGSAVLRCQRVTTDLDGRAVLISEHLFPAHRTQFVVELPNAEPSVLPSGLRLVDGESHVGDQPAD